MTPVLFRVARSGQFKGDVTAVFPTLGANPGAMVGYARIGQHSECSEEWYCTTRPAKPEEYSDLLLDLHQQGYRDLRVFKRRRTV